MKALLPWKMNHLIESERSIGGRFEEFQYPVGPLSRFRLVQFHRKIDETLDCYGLGCAYDLKSAYLKAFYEFLERKAFYENGIPRGFRTTNGIAIHKFKALAQRAALDELLERDAFLIHWYGQIPFEPIPRREWDHLSSAASQIRELGFETVIAKTVYGVQQTLVAFLINTSTAGFVVGTSSGKSLRDDIDKAFTEACTNLFLVGPRDDAGAALRIQDNGIRSLSDHRAYWLHVAALPEWVFEAKRGQVEAIDFNLKPSFQTLAAHPLPAVGVTANQILQLRIGPADAEDREILKSRIRFLDHDVPELSDFLIHPIP